MDLCVCVEGDPSAWPGPSCYPGPSGDVAGHQAADGQGGAGACAMPLTLIRANVPATTAGCSVVLPWSLERLPLLQLHLPLVVSVPHSD